MNRDIEKMLQQGITAHRAGRLQDAENFYRNILHYQPKHPVANYYLGKLTVAANRIAEGLPMLQTALEVNPENRSYWSSYSDALFQNKQFEEAKIVVKAARKRGFDNTELERLLLHLTNSAAPTEPAQSQLDSLLDLYNTGKHNDAEKLAQSITAIYPTHPFSWRLLGVLLRQAGRTADSLHAMQMGALLDPQNPEAHSNLGVTLKELGRLEDAIASYEQAIVLKPDFAQAHYNLGNLLRESGRFEEAVNQYTQAILSNPNFFEAYNNLGESQLELGRLDQAELSYKQAIAMRPNIAEYRFNSSIVPLLKGNLNEGLMLYEYRLRKEDNTAPLPNSELTWDGSSELKGKSFLIYEEQGLGDIIQFSRYLTIIENKGALVTFKVTSRLHKLLKTMKNNVRLTETYTDGSEIDFEAPLMSLPLMLKTDISTIPSLNPYLYADPKKVASFSKELSEEKFKIGICWQGAISKIDVGRSFPLTLFGEISEIPNTELISLQKGAGESQVESIDFKLINLGPNIDTEHDAFLDTAAVMVNCDLIITSDTAIAHLAGALGCPVWVALKYVPDWRWMLQTSDSPWYPSMRLYRQSKLGDWITVFYKMKQDLAELVEKKLNKPGSIANGKL